MIESYSSPDSEGGPVKTVISLCALVSALSCQVLADTTYILYDTVIQEGDFYERIEVPDIGPYPPTVVEMRDGGVESIVLQGGSRLIVYGGLIRTIRLEDSSSVHIHGGEVISVLPTDTSTVRVAGGTVYDIVFDKDVSADVHLSGGCGSALYRENPDDENRAFHVYLYGENFSYYDAGWIGEWSGTWWDGTSFIISYGLGLDTVTLRPGPYVFCDRILPGDLNEDCYVNLLDLAIMAEQWLTCSIVPPEACWQ